MKAKMKCLLFSLSITLVFFSCGEYKQEKLEEARALTEDKNMSDPQALSIIGNTCSVLTASNSKVIKLKDNKYRLVVFQGCRGITYSDSMETTKRVLLKDIAKNVLCIMRATQDRNLDELMISYILSLDNNKQQELFRVSVKRAEIQSIPNRDQGWDYDLLEKVVAKMNILKTNFERLIIE